MARDWFAFLPIAIFLIQLFLCIWGRLRWLRVLPVILLSALVGGSLLLYFGSGLTNWIWLVLLAISSWFLVAVVAAWMVFGLYRFVKKVLHF